MHPILVEYSAVKKVSGVKTFQKPVPSVLPISFQTTPL
tara:strand:- start:1391 stop:1504 length:114 start_codon:yes stop_codon:yes gene_type:complete